MSELFLQIQKTLRDIKNTHDLDFNHPNGVKIGSKLYPAINKRINVVDNDDYSVHHFDIPFENGHTAQWHVVSDVTDPSYSDVYNLVPLHKPNSVNEHLLDTWFYTPEIRNHENSTLRVEPGNHTNVHETLNKWSVLPSKGLIHIGESEPFTDSDDTYPITRDMTEEELHDYHKQPKTVSGLYRNAIIKPPYKSNLINVFGKHHSKIYNITTEELHDVWPR